jgi:hypothetical protein
MAAWGNTIFGFEELGNKDADENPTTVRNRRIQTGRTYTCVVKVRLNQVSAYIDGELLSQWKTDYSDLGPRFSLHHTDTLGLITWESS